MPGTELKAAVIMAVRGSSPDLKVESCMSVGLTSAPCIFSRRIVGERVFAYKASLRVVRCSAWFSMTSVLLQSCMRLLEVDQLEYGILTSTRLLPR